MTGWYPCGARSIRPLPVGLQRRTQLRWVYGGVGKSRRYAPCIGVIRQLAALGRLGNLSVMGGQALASSTLCYIEYQDRQRKCPGFTMWTDRPQIRYDNMVCSVSRVKDKTRSRSSSSSHLSASMTKRMIRIRTFLFAVQLIERSQTAPRSC